MDETGWPRIAVVGAGAVGCYFGGMLARAGAPVTLIGRPGQVDAIRSAGLLLDSVRFRERVEVSASAEMAAAQGAEMVLFSVKTVDTETAATALAPHLDHGANVISLQNGVDNVERIRSASSIHAIAAVVYVAAEVTEPGLVKHTGRGDLIIGDLPGDQPDITGPGRLEQLAKLFARAEVPCLVSQNIQADLWTKLIMNCAYNAISALTGATYGAIAADARARVMIRLIIEECLAVARAAGVRLPESDLVEPAYRLGKAMPAALSSTAQDLVRGKPTEIDSLNGYVSRRGEELGIETPVNRALQTLVKLREGPRD
jgi:2-dehydropantoate 2-reductase